MNKETRKRRTAISFSFLLLVAVFQACHSEERRKDDTGEEDTGKEECVVDFINICHGNADTGPPIGKYSFQFFLFSSEESWKKYSPSFRIMAIPDRMARLENVDFSRDAILVFSPGATGGTGYYITLEKAEIRRGKTRFHLSMQNPPEDEPVAEVMTHPYHMVMMSKADITGVFEFFIGKKKTVFELNIDQVEDS